MLIATWGGNDANAYDTLANVDAFIATSIFSKSEWTELTSSQKTAAILEATRDIDSLRYVGTRYFIEQSLLFPRRIEGPGYPGSRINHSITEWSETHKRMERDVKAALAYQALHIVRLGGRNLHAENQSQGIKSYSETIGPISESYSYGNASAKRVGPDALAKLEPWRESKRVLRG